MTDDLTCENCWFLEEDSCLNTRTCLKQTFSICNRNAAENDFIQDKTQKHDFNIVHFWSARNAVYVNSDYYSCLQIYVPQQPANDMLLRMVFYNDRMCNDRIRMCTLDVLSCRRVCPWYSTWLNWLHTLRYGSKNWNHASLRMLHILYSNKEWLTAYNQC